MQRRRLRLRMWHLLGLVAAFAGLFAVLRYRQEVYDPASAQARRLRALDAAERIEAVGKLAAMGREAESAIPSLVGALNDGDPRVRARAARAMPFVLGTPDHPWADDVRAALTGALADPDPAARHATAVALGMLEPDPKAIVPALIEAAGDADTEVRGWAVGELGFALDDERAWSTVLGATRDRALNVRNQAIKALRSKPQSARLAAVREAPAPALKEPNEVNRGFAANTLGCYAQLIAGDVPELYDALSDPHPFVRRMVCESLPHRPGAGRPCRSWSDPWATWRRRSVTPRPGGSGRLVSTPRRPSSTFGARSRTRKGWSATPPRMRSDGSSPGRMISGRSSFPALSKTWRAPILTSAGAPLRTSAASVRTPRRPSRL